MISHVDNIDLQIFQKMSLLQHPNVDKDQALSLWSDLKNLHVSLHGRFSYKVTGKSR